VAPVKEERIKWHSRYGRDMLARFFDFPDGEKAEKPAILFRGNLYTVSLGEEIHPDIKRSLAKSFYMDYIEIQKESTDGFLTSSGYFLTREEAMFNFDIEDSLELDMNDMIIDF
jgi:hypothetical protein